MTLADVLNHHFSGGSFEYKSFDYKKAKDDFLSTDQGESFINSNSMFGFEDPQPDKYDIPQEIREKYSYWRTGKLRTVHFNPSGAICKILIGAKRPISFYDYNLENLKLI